MCKHSWECSAEGKRFCVNLKTLKVNVWYDHLHSSNAAWALLGSFRLISFRNNSPSFLKDVQSSSLVDCLLFWSVEMTPHCYTTYTLKDWYKEEQKWITCLLLFTECTDLMHLGAESLSERYFLLHRLDGGGLSVLHWHSHFLFMSQSSMSIIIIIIIIH